jgi:hypothetical protein
MKDQLADISALEPDQLVEATKKPFGQRKLGRGETLLIAALRAYVLIGGPLVIYAFFHALLTQK